MRIVTLILFSTFIFYIGSSAQFFSTLPDSVQTSILWSADHEGGDLDEWELGEFLYPGGGVLNTGGSDVAATAVTEISHSGAFSARGDISNAWQAQNGAKAVRLIRWTDKAWDDGGDHFPQECYYSAFYYFPETYNPNKYAPWDPGDGGWWNIFQFKSHDADDVSQPTWTLNVAHDDATEEMSLYFYSSYNAPNSFSQPSPMAIPVGEWVQLECYHKASSPNTADGVIRLWQDGELIIEAEDVITTLEQGYVVWGIGNYTDHIDGSVSGGATVYFDDCAVSTSAIHPHLAGCAADLDQNGSVDVDDFLLFNSSYGQSCDCPADIDGSGMVDVADFLLLNSVFGVGCE